LPQVARHLTSEEDSYGNKKGSQEEIHQQIANLILAHPGSQRQIARQQQGEEKHARFCGNEIQFEPGEEILET